MPSERFSVITDEGYSVLAALGTRLSREAWNIKVGDRVTMHLSIDKPVPGRIVRLATPRSETRNATSSEAPDEASGFERTSAVRGDVSHAMIIEEE